MSVPRVTTAPRVVAVSEASPADRSGLLPGDELLSLNGRSPRDVIEYSLLVDEADLDLVVKRRGTGEPFALSVHKEQGEPLGAEVSSAVFDRVRTCDNHCEFCFIHQLPKGMRRSLSLKDDDYRLSFLYGNFTTLTRFTEMDLERVLTERLSPLFVSIHATDPDIRANLLRNRRGATSLRWLGALLEGGIEIHGQVVVCPDRNNGDILSDTLAGILDRYPTMATVACVPLGVSRFSTEGAMRPHTQAEAAEVCDIVDQWQQTFLSAIGRRMVFAADEYYVMAGRPFPTAETYEGFPQHENGLGMARAFEAAFFGDESSALGVRPGFFAWVDGAPPLGYRAPRGVSSEAPVPGRAPIGILTGEYGAAVLGPLVAELGRDDIRLIPVANHYFGGNIGVSGLLTGTDLTQVLKDEPAGHRY
jgi:putative radical SAM enzyme (TIGR03279 family)